MRQKGIEYIEVYCCKVFSGNTTAPFQRYDWNIVHNGTKMQGGRIIIMANVNLSDGEWKIMNKLWEKESATITELTAQLYATTGWDKHIIITMLNRMVKKGAVSFRINGRAKQFYPLLSQSEVSIRETKGFLDKVYRGSIGMMVNAMVEDKALSRQDIEELYKILEEAEKK